MDVFDSRTPGSESPLNDLELAENLGSFETWRLQRNLRLLETGEMPGQAEDNLRLAFFIEAELERREKRHG